ncbi:MAG: NB-ARC domain-containing protein, partial [Cyanobacteria bacterium J06633_23]
MPRLPPRFLPRPEDLDSLKEKILGANQQPVAVTGTRRGVSIQGMGGIGKSVLAAAIARDEAVRQAFADGVFWVSLGQEPNVLSLQTELVRELGEEKPAFSDVTGGKKFLRELLTARRCFIVLDDIWQEQHLRAFDVLGDHCQMLITTRDIGLVTGIGAVEHSLNLLSPGQSRVLLAGWTGYTVENLPPQADEIARECGYLPLALSMAGAMLKKSRRWDSVLQRLQRADLDKIRQQFPDYEYSDLLKMLQVSVDALEPELQKRYLDFAVFPEDARMPQAAGSAIKERMERKKLDALVCDVFARCS